MFQGQTGVDCFNGTSAFDMRNNYGAFPEFLRTSVYHLIISMSKCLRSGEKKLDRNFNVDFNERKH